VWRAADQARPALALLLLGLLPACSDRISELDPRPVFANIFGEHLAGREPPPGLDQPYPNLSSVPPRPTPPDPATRERISAGLRDDRSLSREPVRPDGRGPLPPSGSGPPPRARVAAMPPIQLDLQAERAAPEPAATPVPRLPAAPAAPEQPAGGTAAVPAPVAPPPPPARDLLAPPAAPSSDLLAPPPPPGRDLLAPRRD
jgi:hypothetical protein